MWKSTRQAPAPCKRLLAQTGPRRGQPCRSASDPDTAVLEDPAKVAWDPKNLLQGAEPVSVGHIEKRLAARRAAQALAATPGLPVCRVPAEALAAGGLTLDSCVDGFDRAGFAEHMASKYVAIDASDNRIRVLNIDPPILSIDGFASDAACEAMVAAATVTGALQRSATGSKTLGTAGNALTQRRTSSSLLVDPKTQASSPALKEAAHALQASVTLLLPGLRWGRPGTLARPGQYTFESLQLAMYQGGEHFLAHEDGFPMAMARDNGFQRRATVLLYLNDVAEGGKTRFECLDISVTPKRGQAIVFFPSFSDNEPDPRTLHTAETAVAQKWVAQQWVTAGVAAAAGRGASPQALAALGSMHRDGQKGISVRRGLGKPGAGFADDVDAEKVLRESKRGKGKVAKGKGTKKASKGFGA